MTARELIDELKQYPPYHNVEIICFDNNVGYFNIVDILHAYEAKDAEVGCFLVTQYVNN